MDVNKSKKASFATRLTASDVYDEQGRPRVDLLREHFFNEGRLDEATALRIVHEATALFRLEKNLIEVAQPVVIVGDVHGQFYDMLRVFEMGGSPATSNYLFLGDYVDRGFFSIEIVLYLWSLKALYPSRVTLLRGNHECKHLAEHFTFKREVLTKYSTELYEACIRSFCALPLCALVNKQVFCVHGGISPELQSLQDIAKISRDREPPSHGIMCDLLWSDPSHEYNSEDPSAAGFSVNLTRGCSYFYGFSAVSAFLKRNDLLCVVRAHEAQDAGFRMYRNVESTAFPSVMTLFSAPNYLDVYNNKAAILVYEKDTMSTKQFTAVPHPYWLPNFMDVFTWSLPFVAEKVTEMFMVMLKINIDEASAPDTKSATAAALTDRREVMRAKLAAISRITRIYSQIRKRNEVFMDLKEEKSGDDVSVESSSADSGRERRSSLLGEDFKRKRRLSLDEIKALDKQNECLPKESSSANDLL
jgi:serine/threonine-protein phosphatase 2B catalytic subunit